MKRETQEWILILLSAAMLAAAAWAIRWMQPVWEQGQAEQARHVHK